MLRPRGLIIQRPPVHKGWALVIRPSNANVIVAHLLNRISIQANPSPVVFTIGSGPVNHLPVRQVGKQRMTTFSLKGAMVTRAQTEFCKTPYTRKWRDSCNLST